MSDSKHPILYRDYIMSKIEGPKLSDEARNFLKEYIADVELDKNLHPDTYAGTVFTFFQEFANIAEELASFGFLERVGNNGYILTKVAFKAKL